MQQPHHQSRGVGGGGDLSVSRTGMRAFVAGVQLRFQKLSCPPHPQLRNLFCRHSSAFLRVDIGEVKPIHPPPPEYPAGRNRLDGGGGGGLLFNFSNRSPFVCVPMCACEVKRVKERRVPSSSNQKGQTRALKNSPAVSFRAHWGRMVGGGVVGTVPQDGSLTTGGWKTIMWHRDASINRNHFCFSL